MPDLETVLVAVYVLADTFCATQPPESPRPGPPPALTAAEVLTLATIAAHTRHQSERAFWRFAEQRLRGAFPTLPSRAQFNRQRRRLADLTARFALALGDPIERAQAPYEVLDGVALPVRSVKRRGRSWLAGEADRGWSTRLGWYFGARLLLTVTPVGTITGFGVGTASCPERQLADTLLAARAGLMAGLPGVGQPATGDYLADGGFAGRDCQARWRDEAGAVVHAPPHPRSRDRWPGPVAGAGAALAGQSPADRRDRDRAGGWCGRAGAEPPPRAEWAAGPGGERGVLAQCRHLAESPARSPSPDPAGDPGLGSLRPDQLPPSVSGTG